MVLSIYVSEEKGSTLSLVNGFHGIADWHREVEAFNLMDSRFLPGMTVEFVTAHSRYLVTKTVHAHELKLGAVTGFVLQTTSRTFQREARTAPWELTMGAIIRPYQFFGIGDGHTGIVKYLRA